MPPRTRIQIFIRTPRRKIDVPIVQMQFQISRRVCQIKPDCRADFVSDLGNAFHIKGLSRVIIHAAEQNERDFIGIFAQSFFNIFNSQTSFAFKRRKFDQQIGLWTFRVKRDLRRRPAY
ncbi:hypothetical protein Bpfe_031258 [Biomphalaria pfeifferi]|uniref:Uncharacterized protein n=1 Tax=Biomphalaria pfeifferi TaxID=112525 RepID=A0AAD8AN74_BIOPF|nr:hypothetical protein Bpfe_031258 [Biomphalaria pfeifferi]